MKEAPIFTRSYDLHGWLLDRLEGTEKSRNTTSAVLYHSRRLLEAITLALQRFDTERRLFEADQAVALLRVFLRLAVRQGLLDDRQLLFANGLLLDIGRQIGGWRKRLKPVR